MKRVQMAFLVALAALVIALPVSAGDVIANGIDVWTTPGQGGTFVNFAGNPIPADFFCTGSQPFAGKVTFKGVPIPTEPEGIFGNADTVIQRLDDAVFASRRSGVRFQQAMDGMVDLPTAEVASTRVQVRAISFVGIEPIRTACGAFTLTARLAPGDQPVTQMVITREHENGGRFFAPLSLNVVLAFSPVEGPARESLEITRRIDFPGKANSFWSSEPGEGGIRHLGFAQIDTSGDGAPDTFVPGTSNFAAGWQNGVAQPSSDSLRATSGAIITPYCSSKELSIYGETECHATEVAAIEAE